MNLPPPTVTKLGGGVGRSIGAGAGVDAGGLAKQAARENARTRMIPVRRIFLFIYYVSLRKMHFSIESRASITNVR